MADLKSSLAKVHIEKQKNRPVKYGGKVQTQTTPKDVKAKKS